VGSGSVVLLGELWEVACLCVGEVRSWRKKFGRKFISRQMCKRTLKKSVEKQKR